MTDNPFTISTSPLARTLDPIGHPQVVDDKRNKKYSETDIDKLEGISKECTPATGVFMKKCSERAAGWAATAAKTGYWAGEWLWRYKGDIYTGVKAASTDPLGAGAEQMYRLFEDAFGLRPEDTSLAGKMRKWGLEKIEDVAKHLEKLTPDEDTEVSYDASEHSVAPCPRTKKIFDAAQKKAVDLTATVIKGTGTSPTEKVAQAGWRAAQSKVLASIGLNRVVTTLEFRALSTILSKKLPDAMEMPPATPPPPTPPIAEVEELTYEKRQERVKQTFIDRTTYLGVFQTVFFNILGYTADDKGNILHNGEIVDPKWEKYCQAVEGISGRDPFIKAVQATIEKRPATTLWGKGKRFIAKQTWFLKLVYYLVELYTEDFANHTFDEVESGINAIAQAEMREGANVLERLRKTLPERSKRPDLPIDKALIEETIEVTLDRRGGKFWLRAEKYVSKKLGIVPCVLAMTEDYAYKYDSYTPRKILHTALKSTYENLSEPGREGNSELLTPITAGIKREMGILIQDIFSVVDSQIDVIPRTPIHRMTAQAKGNVDAILKKLEGTLSLSIIEGVRSQIDSKVMEHLTDIAGRAYEAQFAPEAMKEQFLTIMESANTGLVSPYLRKAVEEKQSAEALRMDSEIRNYADKILYISIQKELDNALETYAATPIAEALTPLRTILTGHLFTHFQHRIANTLTLFIENKGVFRGGVEALLKKGIDESK